MTGHYRPLSLVAAAYGTQLRDHGPNPLGVLWSCIENQQSRFRLLAEVMGGGASRGRLSVNDLGCGYGALFDFLRQERLLGDGSYQGYDICPDMVAAAKRRISDPRASFTHSMAATADADFSFASGTYNLKGPVGDEEWTGYLKDSLLQLWRRSRRGLAFNLLDRRSSGRPQEWLYYADPDDIEDFCRRSLSPDVTRIDGRNPDDTTFLVRRPH